jgi:spore germination protein KB
MEKAKVSVIQLFIMMFVFELGSALVVSLGSNAGRDAWLAILIGLCGGITLFFMYYFLFRQHPTLPLTGYVCKIFGKYIGWMIGLVYTVYFLYAASRNLRDFSELLLTSTMQATPLLAIIILMVLAICYVLYLGIEVLGRTAEVFFVILILLGFAGNFLVLVSGGVDLGKLRPLLENGWRPILTTAFPLVTYFPFAEIFVFSMILPYLRRPELAKKVWLSALISSGLILSYTAALNVSVLGFEEVGRSTFPLLSTIGKVNMMEFLQRLDAIVVFTFLITMFFKIALFFYAAVIGMVDLFKLKNHQSIVFPAGVILTFLSMMIASNFAEHIEEGQRITSYYIHIPLHIIIPFVMMVVAMVRKRLEKKVN